MWGPGGETLWEWRFHLEEIAEEQGPNTPGPNTPGPDKPDPDHPGSDHAGPVQPGPAKRESFARLRDEEQRIAGGGRWSVDSSRRNCALTGEEIPRGTPFWTVLAPADPDAAPESAGPLTAFFSRQDYCDAAMDQMDSEIFFARWRTVIPEDEGPPKRVVNVASLLATFLELAEPSRISTPLAPADAEGPSTGSAGNSGGGSSGGANSGASEVPALEAPAEDSAVTHADSAMSPSGLSVERGIDRPRLAYLLALFLVRKRALVWEDHGDQGLKVREKSSGDSYQLISPDLDQRTLEEAIHELEALFS